MAFAVALVTQLANKWVVGKVVVLLDTSTDNDDDGANDHACSAAKDIRGERDSGGCGNTADVVDHEHNTGIGTRGFPIQVSLTIWQGLGTAYMLNVRWYDSIPLRPPIKLPSTNNQLSIIHVFERETYHRIR